MEGSPEEVAVNQNQNDHTVQVRVLLSHLPHVSPNLVPSLPLAAQPSNDGFTLPEFMKQVADYGGLRRDSPQILEATTILETHGFCSRITIDGLTQDLALEYLKLPVAVWIAMKQLIGTPATQGSQPPPLIPASPVGAPTTPKPRKKKEAKEQITRTALQNKIAQFCDKIGHDQGIFLVKEVDLVQCLVCDSTFKLHKPGQITRLKRHINGETGSQKITRHMRNLLYPKPKDADKSPSQTKKQLPPYPRKRNFQQTEQQMAMQHLKRQRLDLDTRSGILHCHCLQPAKRMISKTDNQAFYICAKNKPEQCDFFQLEGAPGPVGEKSLSMEMGDMEDAEAMNGGEKEGLAQSGEEGHHLMLGEEMGEDGSVLRDFDIQEKGLVLPSISYLTTTSTATSTSQPEDPSAAESTIQATEQEQTQQIQEHQQQLPPQPPHRAHSDEYTSHIENS